MSTIFQGLILVFQSIILRVLLYFHINLQNNPEFIPIKYKG